MFCPNCGKEIRPGGKFCTSCGWKLPESGRVPESGRAPEMPPNRPAQGTGRVPQKTPGNGRPPKKGGAGKWLAIFLAVALGGGALLTGGIMALTARQDTKAEEQEDSAQKEASAGKEKKEKEEYRGLEDAGTVLELSDEEFDTMLEEQYGAFLGPEEEGGPGAGSLYEVLSGVSEITYKEPASWPAEVTVSVKGPDMYALLSGMDAAAYPDADAFRQAVLDKIAAGEFTEKTTEVTAELEGPDLWKTENFELLDALYGGALTFYREKSAEDLENIAGQIGGMDG